MPFQIPQFIEREPKVIGPFTFKQFVYLAVPGAIAFFLYFTVPFTLFIVGAILLVGFGFVLGFLKVGAKSLPALLLDFLHFSTSPKIYKWKKGVAQEAQLEKGSSVQKLGNQVKTR